MLVLFETAAGFAVFKLLDEKKLKTSTDLYKDFQTPEAANNVLKLKQFHKFEDTTEALAAATAAVEGKLSKGLKKMLKKLFVKEAHEELAVADAKLGSCIKDKLKIKCVSNPAIQELMRCIRAQTDSLISGLPHKELTAMALGLAHSLSRYKLKFSPDKVDTMIVQAVSLLDDLDKELNNYTMRCHEWYGWHFPELAKIVTDNTLFVRTVKLLGVRTNAATCDFSTILPEDMEASVKEAAEISMGTEISEEDIMNITFLCDQIIEMNQYREQLYSYLRNRMMAIAPNVTTLVGELIGARLISHAGSLINLAKHPASTVQILGAEKALFRALKSKSQTPKYGLLYHAQMVAQTSTKLKGKVSRMLATKTALACRVDALGEDLTCELGIEHKAMLERRIKMLEDGVIKRLSGTGRQQRQTPKYESFSEVRQYPVAMDSTLGKWGKDSGLEVGKRKFQEASETTSDKPKKKKKRLSESVEQTEEQKPTTEMFVTPKASTSETPAKGKKGKKKKMAESTGDAPSGKKQKSSSEEGAPEETPKKKKKAKPEPDPEEEAAIPAEKKKKKKKQKLLTP